MRNKTVAPPLDFRTLIRVLKKTDPTLMIYPLAPKDRSSNYIDLPVHILVGDPALIRNYFSYTTTKEVVHGVFLIRTTSKSLLTLKENPITMQHLQDNHISLSQKNWLTERKKEMFFLHNASESLTRRDDFKTAITENMPTKIPFGLYPKKNTLYDNGKRTTFRALILDALEDRFDETFTNIASEFRAGDPRLAGNNLVPILPTLKLNMDNISNTAQQQNTFLADLAHLTVRGIKNLDEQMETKDGGCQTLREFFTTYVVEVNGENQQLIHRSERATDNRIFLLFNKAHKQHVRTISADLDTKLSSTFTPASLAASRSASSTPVREINSVTTAATSANEDHLLSLFSNPQNDSVDRNQPPPQHRSRRPIRELQPSEYPKLPVINAWGTNQRQNET